MRYPPAYRRPAKTTRRPRAFTLIEAIVALSITAMAGAVLLLGVQGTLDTNAESVERTIADGLAQQLLDEVCQTRFVEPGSNPLSGSFGPGSGESASGRQLFDDTDDFHGFVAIPAEGRFGEPLGTGDDAGGLRHPNLRLSGGLFDRWRQRIEVYYVSASDHRVRLTSGTSYYRAIEVNVERVETDGTVVPLASRKKVIAYVQPPG